MTGKPLGSGKVMFLCIMEKTIKRKEKPEPGRMLTENERIFLIFKPGEAQK
jgi:hypothetical protein